MDWKFIAVTDAVLGLIMSFTSIWNYSFDRPLSALFCAFAAGWCLAFSIVAIGRS